MPDFINFCRVNPRLIDSFGGIEELEKGMSESNIMSSYANDTGAATPCHSHNRNYVKFGHHMFVRSLPDVFRFHTFPLRYNLFHRKTCVSPRVPGASFVFRVSWLPLWPSYLWASLPQRSPEKQRRVSVVAVGLVVPRRLGCRCRPIGISCPCAQVLQSLPLRK